MHNMDKIEVIKLARELYKIRFSAHLQFRPDLGSGMYSHKDKGYEDMWDATTVKHWYQESIRIAEEILQVENEYLRATPAKDISET